MRVDTCKESIIAIINFANNLTFSDRHLMISMVMMEIYNVNQYNESVIAPFINGSVSDNEKSFMLLSTSSPYWKKRNQKQKFQEQKMSNIDSSFFE